MTTPPTLQDVAAALKNVPCRHGAKLFGCERCAEVNAAKMLGQEMGLALARATVERLWEFARHLSSCPAYEAATNPPYTPCDCGFDELRRELFPEGGRVTVLPQILTITV